MPKLTGSLPQKYVADPVPGRGVPGWGLKLDQTLGSLCAPPCTGHNRDSGGG